MNDIGKRHTLEIIDQEIQKLKEAGSECASDSNKSIVDKVAALQVIKNRIKAEVTPV